MILPIAPFGPALVPVSPRADRADRTVSPAVCSHVRRAIPALSCSCSLEGSKPAAARSVYVRKLLGIPGAPKDNTAFRLKYDTYGDEARKEGG